MQNFYDRFSARLKPIHSRKLLFAACLCVLLGKFLGAQEAGQAGQTGGQLPVSEQPMASVGQFNGPPPCYLGGTSEGSSSLGMLGVNEGYSQEDGYSQYGQQQWQYPQDQSEMGTGAELGAEGSYSQYAQQYGTQQGQYPASQPGMSPAAGAQGSYSQYEQQYGLPQGQYPASQAGMNGAAAQPSMPADQIIDILQQNPAMLTNFKNIAGQRYRVDPATIPDSGIFSCIQQDPGLRSQASMALEDLGYTVNGENAPNASARVGNRARMRPEAEPRELLERVPAPYSSVPSLVDLYSQIVPANGRLRRFGSDAFLIGTGNLNQLPMDLPVGPDYVLGPGDNLILNMWGGVSNRLNLTIDRQGQVALPDAGTISLIGLTIAQAQSAIQKALGTQFQNEHVELSLGRVRTVRVYVVGDVQRPGAYDVSSLSTPLNALFEAGGPTSRGSLRILEQYRGKQLVQKIDLYDFLLRGIRTNVGRLEPGDTILVPPVGPQVTIEGMVRRPAIYELNGEKNLQQVLSLAGGVLITGSLKQINVGRIVAHKRRTMLSLELSGNQAEIDKELTDFQVQGGDDVVILQILPYNEQAVYLEGHVYRPGKYPYHQGMTILDLLHSYQDVLPEPAARAEIIRLEAPDFRPEIIPFNLPGVLVGDESILLKPLDVVHIYGRYDIDPPKVTIFGEVLRPGIYPMSQGMTVADLVRLAGGFNRSAYREHADLASYTVEDGQKVLINHSTIDIEKALEGDKTADLLLKPGDVLGIRELAGWSDIGASIKLTGEVMHPGTYGIEDGERLSSVLERAGGFRQDAFPGGAIFERVQVRELEDANRQEMIQRVESSVPNVSAGIGSSPQDQQNLLTTMRQQQEDVLAALRRHPSTGRMVVRISSNISEWKGTSADIVLRAGDTLTVPKQAAFVMVSGQVYNPTAITYRPGKDAGWYLRQAGGITGSGDGRKIYILHADGSIVSRRSESIFEGGVLGTRMHPGDSVIVPEKIIGGSQLWRNLIAAAQVMSSMAITGAVTGAF